MDMIGKVRRMKLRDQLSDGEICRRTGLARNTVKKWLKAPGDITPKYERKKADGKLTPFVPVLVWCLRSKHQIIAFAARATDAKIVSALLCQTNGFGSWLWRSMYCRMACSNSPMLVWALRLIHLSLI